MAPLCLKTSHVKIILSPGNTDGKITCLTCSMSLWLREVKDAVWGNYHLPASFFMYHYYYYYYLQSHLYKRSLFVRVETEQKNTKTPAILTYLCMSQITRLQTHTAHDKHKLCNKKSRRPALNWIHSVFFVFSEVNSLLNEFILTRCQDTHLGKHAAVCVFTFPQTGD